LTRRSAAAALLATLAVGLGTAACGAADRDPGTGGATSSTSSGPRALTADEADRLAVTRFNNYDRGVVPLSLVVPTDSGQVLTLEGRADLRKHRALASFTTDDTPPSHGVLAWDLRTVALLPTDDAVDGADAGALDDTLRLDGWQSMGARRGDALATALVIALNLAADRPENAQLLRQNGAQWLGETDLDGTAVTLMSAAPEGETQAVTYYVDPRGNLLRADVDTGLDQPATIRFLSGDAAAVPSVPALRQAEASPTAAG
jgi:hypothetical protein